VLRSFAILPSCYELPVPPVRPDWPDPVGWARLREADHLDRLEPFREVAAEDGRIELSFDLPMPSMSLIELDPIDRPNRRATDG